VVSCRNPKSEKLAFPQNSARRRIATERARELQFSDVVQEVYLYKASKDGDDRVVIAIAR